MRKLFFLFFLFFLFLGLSAFPQSRQVRVTTKKGSVFEGTLQEFKAFEHLIVEVNGKNLLIPYETMAYIDDITPKAPSPVVAEPVEAPPVEAPKPAIAASPAVAEPVEAPKQAVAEPVALDHRSLATNGTQEAPPVEAPKGFLLSPGNSVYLHCISDPSDPSFDAAALDVLKRQFRRYNFWTVVDNPAEAHFAINYTLQLQGSAKTVLSISSDRTATQETLGSAKVPEDPDDYRKIVYDLFQKYLLPLQSKISANTPPKRLKTLFTLE